MKDHPMETYDDLVGDCFVCRVLFGIVACDVEHIAVVCIDHGLNRYVSQEFVLIVYIILNLYLGPLHLLCQIGIMFNLEDTREGLHIFASVHFLFS